MDDSTASNWTRTTSRDDGFTLERLDNSTNTDTRRVVRRRRGT
jgi:hypothetical protein